LLVDCTYMAEAFPKASRTTSGYSASSVPSVRATGADQVPGSKTEASIAPAPPFERCQTATASPSEFTASLGIISSVVLTPEIVTGVDQEPPNGRVADSTTWLDPLTVTHT